jgi:hypothetical protein
MKLISFLFDGQMRAGLWLGEQVLDLPAAAALAGENMDLSSVLAIARGGNAQWQTLRKIVPHSVRRCCLRTPYSYWLLFRPRGAMCSASAETTWIM